MKPIRVFEAFAGYGSQAMALKRLQSDFPGKVAFEFVGISEIDKYAIAAYNAVHGDTVNFGDISKIDWAQVPDFDCFTYSFPCFLAGTLVHTNRGYIPIEEVTTADMVLTHTNRYQKVVAVGMRENAPIIKVRGMCFKDIVCTPNHPFYVRRRYRYGHDGERKFTTPEWLKSAKLTQTLNSGKVKEKPMSRTALYKMAGNSIVVDVLYHIFKAMLIDEPPKPKPIQKSLFDF